jgi:hypothetical protein
MARAAVEMLIEEIRRSKAKVPPYTLVTREETDVRAANRRVA